MYSVELRIKYELNPPPCFINNDNPLQRKLIYFIYIKTKSQTAIPVYVETKNTQPTPHPHPTPYPGNK